MRKFTLEIAQGINEWRLRDDDIDSNFGKTRDKVDRHGIAGQEPGFRRVDCRTIRCLTAYAVSARDD